MARPRSRLVALLAVAGLALTSVPSQAGAPPRVERDPRRELGLFVDPKMPAAQEGAAYVDIARRPQALWLSNEYYPREQVADVVRAYTSRAAEAGKTPMLVVYAIPDRDCGQHSSGGLPGAAAYQAWVAEVAAGIRGSKPILVLEPDAIGFYGHSECTNGRKRLRLLRNAVRRLSAAGAWVYLDAGHSGWTPYADRARLLRTAGVGLGRGISTNVSNFRRLGAEKAYAELLLRQLRQDGVKGVKYVVDTSRNGARRPVDGDVINPTWARLGKAPRLRFQGRFDGTLWVKHPGESDGPVNGGPASGQWCDLLADRLLGNDGPGGC
ncbi:Endoglucanase A precursor [Nocardioides dokdonensis FR1436]|uniref:Glucanase n=1 Tax=Nocardioides dokdonensis FR1436 TaxID=1300347 RepID=A0A1A9GH59_9ACTN|nr:glycoside hydrolase family 6 protein [Nocardioides dokdonensis]ANH37649.1 Endoglucanase A precursor [Nocardioides dokdonensis FR1436]